MKYIHNFFSSLVLLAGFTYILFFSACEDVFTKEIQVDVAGSPPKLAVTAVLDTDSLIVSIAEGRSLVAYADWRTLNEPIVSNGIIELYEDGRQILSASNRFDISMREDSTNGYRATFKGFPKTKVGSVYRLRVALDGYEAVESTAVMPEAPMVGSVEIDTAHIDRKTSRYALTSLSGGGWSKKLYDYYPISLQLTDSPDEQDYYSFQQFVTIKVIGVEGVADEQKDDFIRSFTANASPRTFTGNINLIRDNPDFEAEMSLFENEQYDLYGIDMMLLTDATFAGKTTDMMLYTSLEELNNPNSVHFTSTGVAYGGGIVVTVEKQKRPDYNPETDGPEIQCTQRIEFVVKHVTSETFRYYRSLALLQKGIDFFTEPMNANSNLENGYGCFSVSSSIRVHLLDDKKFYYR